MTIRRNAIWMIPVLASGVAAAHAQVPTGPDTTLAAVEVLDKRSLKIAAYPYAFYTPETELALGAGGIATFYTTKNVAELQPSKVSLGGYYSTRKQYKFSQTTQLYLDANRWFVLVPLTLGSFVDKYWGVGNRQPDIENADFDIDAFQGRITVEGPTPIPFAVRDGFVYEYSHRTIKDTRGNPHLDPTVAGYEGGTTSGLGLDVVKDTRNHVFWPNTGGYHRTTFLWFDGFLGSDYDYTELEMDLRRYLAVGPEQVLAFHVFAHFLSRGAPFYELPALGGGAIMRGYYQGRYRDLHYVAMQAEYRRPLWRRLGAVVFGGIGDVFGSGNSVVSLDNLKYSCGFGLRFLFNRRDKINLRADFGFGQDGSGVYFGLEEAF